MLNPNCRYQIDINDKIVSIEGGWVAFARANGGEAILDPCPIDKPIWSFITGLSTRFFYQMLISQVRETGTSVRFPFRCDSPDLLRYMEMEISLGEEDSVWFQTYLKRQVSVDSIPNHNGKESLRDTHLIKICAWCRLVLVQNNWYSLEDAVWMLGIFDESEAPEITHGICYDCGELMKQEMEILKSSSNIFNFSNA